MAELTDERNWRSGLRVRLLLRRQVDIHIALCGVGRCWWCVGAVDSMAGVGVSLVRRMGGLCRVWCVGRARGACEDGEAVCMFWLRCAAGGGSAQGSDACLC